jgi:dTDP-4-amino-4,6-dideoxygalactose transaminase
MAKIWALAKKYGFFVLEDASHAVGGRYQDQAVGACVFSDMAVFSFHPVKIVTTAEGGMIMTRDAKLAEQARLFRSHGITRDEKRMEGASEGPWYYQQIELGFNYRLTDLQAALGESQLKRIDGFVARRRQLAARYDSLLRELPIELPFQSGECESAWHLYAIQLSDAKRRREVFEKLRSSGIGVNVHYIPVHLQPYYQRLGFKAGDFPEAEKYYEGAISLPMYFGLSDESQDRVVDALTEALT